MGQRSLLGFGLGLLLMGCALPSGSAFNARSNPVAPVITTQANTLSQSLPITAQITIAGQVIQLEVANTAQQQAIGLMGRTSLANDRGMLFPFNPPRPAQFWMKNTLISLDMLFIRKGVIKAIAVKAPPCKADPCPTYGSGNEVIDQVVEVRGGRAAELGLKVGDRISIQFLNKPGAAQNP